MADQNNEQVAVETTETTEVKETKEQKQNIFRRGINWVKDHKLATLGIGTGVLTAAGFIAKKIIDADDDAVELPEIPIPEVPTEAVTETVTEAIAEAVEQ